MTKLIDQVDQLKAELENKLLDYYEANQDLFDKMKNQNLNDSWFRFGIILALEPKSELRELLEYFFLMTDSASDIIKALELNFNLQGALEERKKELAEKEAKNASEYLDQIRQEIKT